MEKLTISCEADGKRTVGFVERRDLPSAERGMRALRIFGILFAIGLGTIVVPILHFILPPLFLLAAIVMAVVTWISRGEVLGGEIACPNCGVKIEFPRGDESWPRVQRCPGCSYTLTIVKEKDARLDS